MGEQVRRQRDGDPRMQRTRGRERPTRMRDPDVGGRQAALLLRTLPGVLRVLVPVQNRSHRSMVRLISLP